MGGIVSGVSDLFGGATNNAGTVAQGANLIQPVTQQQVNQGTGTASNALGQALGYANQLQPGATQGLASQAALTQALQNEANGAGPNPAQAQLAQATGQNVNQQAALAAGQRGASQNVGLLAREVGQQGAGIQQAAAGQAATLGAQQQLAAQQQLQNLAGQQVGQAQQGIGVANQAAQQNQNALLGSLGQFNTNQVQNVASQNAANASIANNNANNSAGALGGLLNGAGGALAGNLFGGGGASAGAATGVTAGTQSLIDQFGGLALAAAKGGEIPAQNILAQALSKKSFPDHMRAMAQIYHPKVMKMYCGGMAEGAVVPGEPDHPGKNLESQDKVPAMLTPKEIVLPLTVTQAKNPGEAAKAFVENIKGKSSESDFKQALRDHVKNRKSKR